MKIIIYLSMLCLNIYRCHSSTDADAIDNTEIKDGICEVEIKKFYKSCSECDNEIMPYIKYTFESIKVPIDPMEIIPDKTKIKLRDALIEREELYVKEPYLEKSFLATFLQYIYHLFIYNIESSYVILSPNEFCKNITILKLIDEDSATPSECLGTMKKANFDTLFVEISLFHMLYKIKEESEDSVYIKGYFKYVKEELRLSDYLAPMGTSIRSVCSMMQLQITNFALKLKMALNQLNYPNTNSALSADQISVCKIKIRKFFSNCTECDYEIMPYINYIFNSMEIEIPDETLTKMYPDPTSTIHYYIVAEKIKQKKNNKLTKLEIGVEKNFISFCFIKVMLSQSYYLWQLKTPEEYCNGTELDTEKCKVEMKNARFDMKNLIMAVFHTFFIISNKSKDLVFVDGYFAHIKMKLKNLIPPNEYSLILFCDDYY